MIARLKTLCVAAAGLALCTASLTFAQDKADAKKTGGAATKSPIDPKHQKASSDEAVIEYINELIRKGWADAGLKPAAPATDGEWCRRVFLDLLGRIPRVEELNEFLNDKEENKKAKLVDKLLTSTTYEEEVARNFTTIWTNILIGRNGGNDPQRPVNRIGMMQYLRRSFLKNKPYDKMVFELISADGGNTPGTPDYKGTSAGAANFILDNLQEGAVPATNKVSQIFLGMRVGCTQCHNHPFNDWKQNAFWELNAFFKQAKPLRSFVAGSRDIESAVLADEDYEGEDKNPSEAAIFYELRNGLMKVAYPKFIDGREIGRSGFVSDVNRRDELAKLVSTSPYMHQALVNRMWGHFMGFGFTKPLDDMGPHNPPSHPELIERLGNDFAAYGYDMKRVMRWFTLCEAYGLSSKISKTNEADDPGRGETPMFSHFYLRQMNAEQLYDSLLIATAADKTLKESYEEQEKTKNQWLQQFVIAFGTDENDESTTFNGSIPQALMLMNGDLVKKAVSTAPGGFLATINASGKNDGAKISFLYRAALARDPSTTEAGMANKLWQARGGDAAGALQDVWWALLNCNEFIINH
jgi:hypothetical protein